MRDIAKQYSIDWLRRCLPELQSLPVEIIGRDEQPERWHPNGCTQLEAVGHLNYHPDVFRFVVDYGKLPQGNRLPTALRNIACHEALHHLLLSAEPPAAEPAPAEPELPESQRLSVIERLVPRYCPWWGHEADFIRLACHLVHRSTATGDRLWPWEIVAAGELYGLSDLSAYQAALGDEPQQLAGLTLVDVARIPIPKLFRDFFAWDCQQFQVRQETAAAVTDGLCLADVPSQH